MRLKSIQDIVQGDRLVFRVNENRDTDLIKDTAKVLYGTQIYQTTRRESNLWKEVLLEQSLSVGQLRSRLASKGLKRTEQAIRSWITSPYVIGVQNKSDLDIILSLSIKPLDDEKRESIWLAIKKTRVMHIQAGRKLQSLLDENLNKLASKLQAQDTKRFNLRVNGKSLGRVEIVEVEDISETTESRPPQDIDKLLKEG